MNSTISPRLRNLYLAEGISSIAGSLLTVGIFFYTQHQFQWRMSSNLLLATVQGCFYVVGALSAHALTKRWGRRRSLMVLYSLMALATAMAGVFPKPAVVVAVLSLYQLFSASAWPMLESLVSGRSTGHELSRRLGRYNVTWSVTGALIVAASGLVIEHFPRGVFLIPCLVHISTALILWKTRTAEQDDDAREEESLHAEEALLKQRRLALWLSRIALPATYVVAYSLSATMPSIKAVAARTPAIATLICSVWLAARCGAFIILGRSTWWHTRPKVLLYASALMLLAFPAALIPAALSNSPLALSSLLFWQLILGAGTGLIYTASLYFGMVLSEGSTEHSGYHEALIGLGQILGPGSGGVALLLWPNSVLPGIGAVTGVITLCVAAGVVATARAARPQRSAS